MPALLLPKTVIYGEVVDQHGQPVARAQVDVTWFDAAPFPFYSGAGERRLLTDKDGHWQMAVRKMMQHGVTAKLRPSPDYDYMPDMVGYGAGCLDQEASSPTNRIRLQLRRRGEGTLLVQDRRWPLHGYVFKLRVPTDTRDVSLLRTDVTGELEEKVIKTPPPWYHPDLRITASVGSTGRACLVTFTMLPEDGSGIIVTNKLLFEAPPSGYVTSATVRVPDVNENRGDFRGYAYVRSHSPSVYRRIIWTAQVTTKWSGREVVADGITFSYETVTNPYGERNLEEDQVLTKARWAAAKRLTGQVPSPIEMLVSRLEKEARDALDAGRLAEKPDLKRLIDEATQEGKKR